VGTRKAYMLDSPLENGYCESLSGRFRDELLRGEML
jgi:hypothetical protein